eukprot:TRINITY_DN9345_c0_g2_i1.p1 TRINITY_DN9345_c0_g2~~TRINITY_DN9345_c0_g2_i1.p1  ORF type:complete len:245 (+),score=41.16 TRINITY_DN9345_c0_g2_i1:21-755(+)
MMEPVADTELSIVCRRAPFDHGLLPIANAARITVTQLRLLALQAQTPKSIKRETIHGNGRSRPVHLHEQVLSFSRWQKWACSDQGLHMSPDVAWNCFETFDVLQNSMAYTFDRRHGFYRKVAAVESEEELWQVRSKATVPVLPFLVFIYLQRFTSSHFDHMNDTPQRRMSVDERHSYNEHQRQLQTERRLFVWNNMLELITLCVPQHEPQGDEMSVSLECASALGWLLKMRKKRAATKLAKVSI